MLTIHSSHQEVYRIRVARLHGSDGVAARGCASLPVCLAACLFAWLAGFVGS